jgi:iron complex transport system substrate-binding protein
MSFKIFTFKLKLFLIALFTTVLIVACQNNSVRQPISSQLADCLTVEHFMGEVCVPKTPQSLVTLDSVTLADALALGVQPIGSAVESGTKIDYLMKQIKNRDQIELLGQSEQPNLEKILMLKPDLIMGIKFFGEPIFSQLSQIAPTAVGEWTGDLSWREYFNFVARVLHKEAEAQQVWDSYYQRIAEIKKVLGDKRQVLKVSTVYALQGINISTATSFIGSILADIGISQPTYAAVLKNGNTTISEEAIPDIDADILFIGVYDTAKSKDVLADWEQKPLWKQLKAVREGRVYVVNGNIWEGANIIAANLVLDDLYKYLVNK